MFVAIVLHIEGSEWPEILISPPCLNILHAYVTSIKAAFGTSQTQFRVQDSKKDKSYFDNILGQPGRKRFVLDNKSCR